MTSYVSQIAMGLRKNQGEWNSIGLLARISACREFISALESNAGDIIEQLQKDCTRDHVSKMEFWLTTEKMKYWCDQVLDIGISETEGVSTVLPNVSYKTIHHPYPLVGCISPWNFPLLLSFVDAFPALLAGCSVMIKPSEETLHFTGPVIKAINSVPAISKVLALVLGKSDVGKDVVEYSDFVCFTGSVATGRKVAVHAAQRLIPVCLELGGKDPVIICHDAEISSAAAAVIRASCSVSGQGCQSVERVYVDEKICDGFIAELVKQAGRVPSTFDDENGIMLPFIVNQQADIVKEQIQDATDRGAVLEFGGTMQSRDGHIWSDITILSNVDHDMKVMTEETFGPVIPVMKYSTIAEAIELANDSQYGLSAAVISKDMAKANEIARSIQAGAVSINDAALTTLVSEAEKNSFKSSGLGPSRMGDSGYQRFFRKQSLLTQNSDVTDIHLFAEKK